MTDAGPTGPGRIRSIAVHREDVATALEATLRSDRTVVLRVTPPFSGRMRARLHSLGSDSSAKATSDDAADESEAAKESEAANEADREPIHIDPRDLVDEVPPYPEVDDTAAEYPDADVETRRERHGAAVETWRERVRRSVVASVTIDGDGGATREIDVVVLG
ncbi:hypothetical protein C461_06764 [Halorubrum aidingense JCM 13560]|uniref:DUF8009 domain-containing protein n=1 Tax=Halorubrum aidingense JCM 13560 TaxID=1230454 RepID=M0PEF2_9EURY|nr:hypothetical protein [Halorubrum aidingense]EMA68263.1 hypothetical protein C461_06764 [Halorubrum aidingense JCM 13560]